MSEQTLEKFQSLLRELFQFEKADLDFGIYRIMNRKRELLTDFIDNQLPDKVAAALAGEWDFIAENISTELTATGDSVKEHLGDDAFDESDELVSQFQNTPLGRAYLFLQKRAAGGKVLSRDKLQTAAFNYLHDFFSRYFDEGDFISKKRYGGRAPYAVPYNGEETVFHWANRDQYYVKTTEMFSRYAFRAGEFSCRFALQSADLERDNNKGDKRFYFPLMESAAAENKNGAVIPFEYRPMTAADETRLRAAVKAAKKDDAKKTPQETVISEAVKLLPQTKLSLAIKAALGAPIPDGGDSVLGFHLSRFVRRNTSDYFIHKNLRAFLDGELNYYLQSEVLNVDELAAGNTVAMEQRFTIFRAVRNIGREIIDFVAQIEDLQKQLWEKRKFITATNYIVTAAAFMENKKLLKAAAMCEKQWKEWRDLLGESAMSADAQSLFVGKNKKEKRLKFLRENPTLSIDTGNFDSAFTDSLLASFDDIEKMCGGILIHGENFQALNLLREKYRGRVQCVYIDPPYNTDASAIIYKNGYKNSSWLSMMENRLTVAKSLLVEAGVLCCAIDDEEVSVLRMLLNAVFAKEVGVAVVRSNPAGRKSVGHFSPSHEYAFFYGGEESVPGSLQKTEKEKERYPLTDEIGRYAWNNLIRHGSNDRREDRPKQFYPIYVGKNNSLRVPKMEWNNDAREWKILEKAISDEVVVIPVRQQNGETIEKNWHHHLDASHPENYRVRRNGDNGNGNGGISIDFKIRMDESAMPKTWWDSSEYSSANYGARILKDLFGENLFNFPKSAKLVEDCLRASGATDKDARVLDYFAGSGTTAHAVINLNREDGGGRRFVLVEMGEYFNTVLLPRIKKIMYTPEWKDGKPKRPPTAAEISRTPQLVKYHKIESYDDAMDNIAFGDGQKNLPFDDYRMQYQLRWETKGSATLLAVEKLQTPFSYKLQKANGGAELSADLPETFNYLIGLQTQKRRLFQNGKNQYLVFTGTADGKQTAVIWRETKNWKEKEWEKDRDFIVKEITGKGKIAHDAAQIFVNDDSIVRGAKSLDPTFKAKMFEEEK